MVPDRIPQYFKVPIKDLNSPLILDFHYRKSEDPFFASQRADLLVFASETESQPQTIFLKDQSDVDEIPKGKSDKATYRIKPVEMLVAPKAKKWNVGADRKVVRFDNDYLYLCLLSKSGNYQVRIVVRSHEPDPRTQKTQLLNVKQSVAVSAVKRIREKKELVAQEVYKMMQDPFYYSHLLVKAEQIQRKRSEENL